MQYRKFGELDWQVSALGFGCMRLPTTGKPEDIDELQARRMLLHAIDQGVNYIDTAYGYHGGNSERFVGRVLNGEYRKRVRLATKMPGWLVKTSDDFDRLLDEQLEKLRTKYIDFYLLHALTKDRWHEIRDKGFREWASHPLSDGRVRYIGFSFHDDFAAFKEIVDDYDWTFCQIQYNYIDIENQAGTRGLQYAASKKLAVVVMEPLLGGRLVRPPQPILDLWDSSPARRSPADWALQWVWNQPEVSVVLSGMSTLEQVEQNLSSAEHACINSLSVNELALIDQVRARYSGLCPIPCTRCGYCLPCPNGVDIPRNFDAYNAGIIYQSPDWARNEYNTWIPQDNRASECIQCLECEDKCPQHIPISEWNQIVQRVLGDGQPYP